ncbi:MAG: aldehyde dehydrogenase family protein [Bryobacteraceae bacterium]
MQHYTNFIAGKWVPPQAGGFYETHNPAHPSQVLGEFPSSRKPDAEAAVDAAEAALPAWAETPAVQRGALLFRFAQLLEDSKTELAKIITLEQGKALGEATGEVSRAAAEARYMAGEASRPLGETFPTERAGFSCYTIREPLGVVATISPWNFPVVTPVRKIAPAIAFGNTVVFKPASLTPWSAVYLMQLLEKAGLPAGVVNLAIGPGSAVGDGLVADRRVRGISFTGSSDIGTRIYENAARRIASVQLELGGKNPAIVFGYDNLEGAAQEIVSAAFLCSGQRCTALSRVIVSEAQADLLVEKILHRVACIKVGDGMVEGITMGPLIGKAQLEIVDGYVRQALESGCTPLTGGRPLVEDPDRQGYYYAPTVFDRVAPESPLALEEIFGPVLPIIRVREPEQAIAIANGTRYGLAASVFTSRLDLTNLFAKRIEAGMIHINHGTASQAHVPFGGRKDSGQGAFSIGPTARDFFTNVKAVYAKW